MPLHSWIDDDFAAFRAGFLAVTPSVPLQLNLRAVMAPALGKLRRYSEATVAVHFFTNPWDKEIHVMACGTAKSTVAALNLERYRRAAGMRFVPSDDLPVYSRQVLASRADVERLFKSPDRSRDEEYKCLLAGPLLKMVREIAERFPAEFKGQTPSANDLVIILPLRNGEYPRLGHFVLWSHGNALRVTAERPRDQIVRSTFQVRIREIIVRLFTNYYKMRPDTYLPSYYLPGRKEVTFLSAEIGIFHKIWDQVRDIPLTPEDRTKIRLSLVNKFLSIATDAIESNGGRIDQNWGSGFLAVFGEYPGDRGGSPRVSVKEALTTARLLVDEFSEYAGQWMKSEFKIDQFPGIAYPTTPMVGIGIHRASALFDYFGSEDHRTFLAVGDHVSFVKTLASIAGASDEFREKPIILHHSAEKHARDILDKVKGCDLPIPGVAGAVKVFPISKENLLLEPNPPHAAASSV